MPINDPPLPDGSVINGQILVTSYFDEKGRMKYYVGVNGDLNVAQALGLLVLGGISVHRMHDDINPPDEDDEEMEGDEDE